MRSGKDLKLECSGRDLEGLWSGSGGALGGIRRDPARIWRGYANISKVSVEFFWQGSAVDLGGNWAKSSRDVREIQQGSGVLWKGFGRDLECSEGIWKTSAELSQGSGRDLRGIWERSRRALKRIWGRSGKIGQGSGVAP